MDMRQQPNIGTLVRAVVTPFRKKKIETWDMYGRRVHVERGPTVINFALQLRNPEDDLGKALGLGPAIETYVARVIGLPFGATVPIRLASRGAYLIVEMEAQDPWRPAYPELEEFAVDGMLLGLDTYCNPIHFDLLHRPPGMLVFGKPDSGKSNAMRLLAAQWLAQGWLMALADYKLLRSWRDFEQVTSWQPATTDKEVAALLKVLRAEMDARNAGEVEDEVPILVVVDEISDCGDKQIQKDLAQLVKMGRECGFRFIIGSQRAGTDDVNVGIKNVMDVRLVGKMPAAEEYNSTNRRDVGVDRLQKHGDMVLIRESGEIVRLQVARADPEDVTHLLQKAPVERGREREPATRQVSGRAEVGAPIEKSASTALAKRPESIFEALGMLEREAEDAGDGRKVPAGRIIGKASEWLWRNDVLPSFGMLNAWHSHWYGQGLSVPRRRDVRRMAALLNGREDLVEQA